MNEVTIWCTPIFSSSFSPFVNDWNTPGTSRMLKYDLVGPDISTLRMSLEKFRFGGPNGELVLSDSCKDEGDMPMRFDAYTN